MSGEQPVRIEVADSAAGRRLDSFLAEHLDVARNRVQRWISEGLVTLSRGRAKASFVLSGGESIEILPPPRPASRLTAEPGDLVVLLEDEDIAVIDKPAGLAMHPGAGRPDGTLANRALAKYPEISDVGGPGRPGIVHRLDADTTGAVVLARTDLAYRALSEDFAERRVDKTYLAICHGVPQTPSGVIDRPIGRHRQRRTEMTVRPDGRPSVSTWELVDSTSDAGLLSVGLETGRTHQIRVHLKAIGHPLVGDPVYGEARWKSVRGPARGVLKAFARPALHAWKLRFRHPRSRDEVEVIAPPPRDLKVLWADVGGGETLAAL